MEQTKSERDLAIEYRASFEEVKMLDEKLKEAKRARDRAEHALLEWLETEGKSSVDYDGIGRFSVMKPRLYASCTIENQEQLRDYLVAEGRDDLIKTTVNSNSLSTFVKEKVTEGNDIPDFINTYYKTGVKIT